MYLLDTNIVIAHLKGEKPASSKVLTDINQIALSSLVIAELDYGAKEQSSTIVGHDDYKYILRTLKHYREQKRRK